MNEETRSLIEQLKIHKKNLADLQIKEAKLGIEVPLHIRRQIEDERNEINHIETEIRKVNKTLAQDINEVRVQIITAINKLNQVSFKVSGFENLFLTHVLLPGFQLQQTIQKRKFLEQGYNRLRDEIEKGVYSKPEAIEVEVHKILRHAEVAYAYKEPEQYDDRLNLLSPTATLNSVELDISLSEKEKEDTTKEFKRTVLPKVHPDTSKVPFEVFNNVYESYKRKDYLMMKAFIIQYRGELSPNSEDPATFFDVANTYLQEYKFVLEALNKRIERLEEDETVQRLEHPEKVRQQIQRQNMEIRKAMFEEAEQILLLRSCLEDLAKFQ